MENQNEAETMDIDDAIEEEDESESDEQSEITEQNDEQPPKRKVYLPGHGLKDNEVLEPDSSAYVMLHEAYAGTPCLSFDIIPDNLGNSRETFPHSCYMVCGTQAEKKNKNSLIVMKLSNLRKTLKEKDDDDDDDDSSSSSSEEELDAYGMNVKAPVMNSSTIPHFGCVNRIRTCQLHNTILAASWSELGRVCIWDLKAHLSAVEKRSTIRLRSNKKNKKAPAQGEVTKPLYIFSGHLQEGYAMDWSSTVPGVLATGDCSSNIHLWSPQENSWNVDQRPLKSHTKSVEDLQWSPNESNVLASCSVDKSVKIWDIRAAPSKACMLSVDDAHLSDVNVISWNKSEPLIVSGGDDGYLKVWDLRQFKKDAAVATFKHHTEPVTTVEWHPSDSSVFASGGEDNQIAIWDLSVERDNEFSEDEIKEIPPQLLFIHLGQECVKELHWHPQIPGVIISTAQNGINVFKTISV